MPYQQYAAILGPEERRWAHIQPWLQSKGYMLRPRFRVGWTPSWLDGTTVTTRKLGEDSLPHNKHACGLIMDAVRISDGRLVVLKRFELPANGQTELEVNTILSSEPLKNDPRNPALPMLDVIYAPDQCFMVFPFGHSLYGMELDTIGEGLDFVEQTLEGLVFLHENRIAHRDCAITNIVGDSPRMYPRGIHLDGGGLDLRGKSLGHIRTRTQVGGMKYYFIDFGESIKFGPSDSTRIVVHSKASIAAPETADLSLWPYDAFKPDIYTLGTTYKRALAEVYTSFDMLNPLLDAMTQRDPDARPSAAEALELYKNIKGSLSRTALHGRLHKRKDPPESSFKRVFFDCLHYTEQIAWAAQNLKW
ncbi:uncharacterized protein STEHIDRAFT_60358 [Stereum hirsutum FP-91666 SS1]|uniref:uncharacterized protein n=1 Tax=Stereum hirsutum (strain FP-91666) TaxID=721885 RepID=UPI00044492A0|nr:uncharacterized protein STEHIDRAFT_60358 [Stereum hirsutum FP-91666 SS1]EIM85012.1 hypothetical protein STEHIDRAFT_60358 [Stereum hirsutum FP-91666 SS1]